MIMLPRSYIPGFAYKIYSSLILAPGFTIVASYNNRGHMQPVILMYKIGEIKADLLASAPAFSVN